MANTRIHFEIPEDKAKRLESLMELCHVTTKKDLFNNALSLLEWAVEEKKSGYDIASINKETNLFRELRMPILSHV